MTNSLVLAHATHWVTYILFLGPALSVVIWLALLALRERRAMRDGEGATGDESE